MPIKLDLTSIGVSWGNLCPELIPSLAQSALGIVIGEANGPREYSDIKYG